MVRPVSNQPYATKLFPKMRMSGKSTRERTRVVASRDSLFSWLSFWRHAKIALKGDEAMAYPAHPVATAMQVLPENYRQQPPSASCIELRHYYTTLPLITRDRNRLYIYEGAVGFTCCAFAWYQSRGGATRSRDVD